MVRSSLALLLAAVTAAALASRASARETVIVLDRGRAAQADAPEHARRALALLAAFAERESPPRLMIYGTRPDGRTRAGDVKGDPEKTLATSVEKEGWAFDGETDPRKALELAVRRAPGEEPVDVFLVGPFEGDPLNDSRAENALAAWTDKAPEGSRIHPVGVAPSARERISDLAGYVAGGWIVFAVGEIEAHTEPWSPFEEVEPFRGRVEVALDLVPIGEGFTADPLQLRMDAGTAGVLSERTKTGIRCHLVRPKGTGPEAEISFGRLDSPEIFFFAEIPAAQRLTWSEQRPDVRLLDVREVPATRFVAEQVEVGRPRAEELWLWASRAVTGAFTAGPEEGALPPGLDVELDPVARERSDRRGWRLHVRFRAEAARPLEAEGTILLSNGNPDLAVRLPYRVSVPPGRAFVRLLVPADETPMPLPATRQDPAFTIDVRALNGNVPGHVLVDLVVDPPELAGRLTQRLADETGALLDAPFTTRLSLAPGTAHEVRFGVKADQWPADGRLALRWVDIEGVEGAVEGEGAFRARRPRLLLEDGAPLVRVTRGDVVTDRPFALRVDPDGGDASWRARLLAVPPTVETEQAAWSWTAERWEERGWRVVPAKAWDGARGEVFRERPERLDLTITWPPGEAPGRVEVSVVVAPRWGRAGWILVGLAVIAALIGLIAVSQMRPPPVRGTLLYAVEGKEGAVGRLDLGPVGRGRAFLRADAAGRLHLGGGGETLARLRATRIGGMLEIVPGVAEATRERHLLVDGLTVDLPGRHRLRYLSGAPEDEVGGTPAEAVPDLLGPEFDLPGGRIHGLGRAPSGSDGSGDDEVGS